MQSPVFERLFERIDVTKYPAKRLIVIPLSILVIAVFIIALTQVLVGSPVRLGTDFVGGTVVKVQTTETIEQLEVTFADFPVASIRDTGAAHEKSIEFGQMSETEKDALIAKLEQDYGSESEFGSFELRDISPLFAKELQRQAVNAIIIAFILMAIVVFIVFRTLVPPFAVIIAAFSNIVVAVACMNVIGLELSLGTVAALLMLIGYSVDSNILLTTNLLRKKGDVDEKIRSTMKTGVTMTFTTLSAVVALFLVSSTIHYLSAYFAPIPILRDLSLVLLFGLVMDLLNTWLLNAGILRWYIERKESRKFGKRSVGAKAPVKKSAKRGEKRKDKSSTV
ncbi:MAG TPA: protein translocase subunit SecF [Methanomicrobia archaeon]|mgnify:CR=1 FL=1|nr:protein translocase subunit SecF [Methanomicrobia archaeon]